MTLILWNLRFPLKYYLWFIFGKYSVNILCMLKQKVNYLSHEELYICLNSLSLQLNCTVEIFANCFFLFNLSVSQRYVRISNNYFLMSIVDKYTHKHTHVPLAACIPLVAISSKSTVSFPHIQCLYWLDVPVTYFYITNY